jgi:hypothetical protein
MEIGPYRVQDTNTLVLNNGSWHEYANLLFVDNPVGTGFSYVDTDSYVRELDEMAKQMIVFLDKFFDIFPEYDRDDVSIYPESRPSRLRANSTLDLHCWRILCRPVHPLCRESHPRPEQESCCRQGMEPQGSPHRKWLDFP